MKPRAMAAGVLLTGCGLTFAAAAWHGGRTPQAAGRHPAMSAAAQKPAGFTTLRPGAPFPWMAGITSRVRASPSTGAATAPAATAPAAVRLARNADPGLARASASGNSAEEEPGIGEPVAPEDYLAASDRAAAHSARSR